MLKLTKSDVWTLIKNVKEVLNESVSTLEIDEWIDEVDDDHDGEIKLKEVLKYYSIQYTKKKLGD